MATKPLVPSLNVKVPMVWLPSWSIAYRLIGRPSDDEAHPLKVELGLVRIDRGNAYADDDFIGGTIDPD